MRLAAILLTAVTFVWLFALPIKSLARDWWTNPEAGHGLLLAPLAIWLAWRAGLRPERRPQLVLGLAMIVTAVVIRYLSGLAAEQFTSRMSLVLAIGGLVVFFAGLRQALAWWLPFTLLVLSVPLPEVVLGAIALPLQFKASQLGAALLETRQVPVVLSGNVIRLPGHDLFVTEACSGLRSLTALLSLAILLGGISFKHPSTRVLLVLASIPVAILINGVRVFMTGFLVLFVDPKLGEGFAHMTEGWLLFLVSFASLALLTWIGLALERRFVTSRAVPEGAHA